MVSFQPPEHRTRCGHVRNQLLVGGSEVKAAHEHSSGACKQAEVIDLEPFPWKPE